MPVVAYGGVGCGGTGVVLYVGVWGACIVFGVGVIMFYEWV